MNSVRRKSGSGGGNRYPERGTQREMLATRRGPSRNCLKHTCSGHVSQVSRRRSRLATPTFPLKYPLVPEIGPVALTPSVTRPRVAVNQPVLVPACVRETYPVALTATMLVVPETIRSAVLPSHRSTRNHPSQNEWRSPCRRPPTPFAGWCCQFLTGRRS